MLRWGLVPSWSKDPSGGARMINARSESAAQKPAFRRALDVAALPAPGRRLVRVAARRQDHKQPYFTHYRDGSSIALAGLWEYWKPKDDPEGEYPDGLVTAAVLTTAAVGPAARRCTTGCRWCCRRRRGRRGWTRTATPDDDAVAALLAPPSPELVAQMELRPVSPRVNNVRNNGPELLAALPPDEVAEPLQLDLLAGPNPQ